VPGIAEILSKAALFHSVSLDELNRLTHHVATIELLSGATLFQEGEPGEHLYVVLDGQIEAVKALGTAEERIIGVRGPGEFIGEMGLFNLEGLRTASVRATCPSRLAAIARQDFDALLDRQPRLAYDMVRVLANRLRDSENEVIRDFKEKNRQLRQAYEELKHAQAALVEKEKLERELQLAGDIQRSVLPDDIPELSCFRLGAVFVPARAVGGDFYDFIPLGKDRLAVVAGDVTDKGVPAALFMAQTHALLRAEANARTSPYQTLLRVNRHLLEMNGRGLFVTMLYGILDGQSGTFEYARAGHELPILFSTEGSAPVAPQGRGQPLGILEKPEIDQHAITIPPRHTLLLYTDGATDAQDLKGQSFGRERLLESCVAAACSSPQSVCQSIYQTLQCHQAGGVQFDDITLVSLAAYPSG
jgi:serine phosphatase RsbU (regulator of sigma subunit)